ncbi:MAG: hypothetical protein K2G58_05190 [Alistipes sp.]|nr:hypothetical protein [Alistipes sp.]
MKKLLVYAVAAIAAMNAGCSKDPGVDDVTAGGKYTLPALTASCEEDATRTSLGNNRVVNWSNNDRIAVVNLKTNTIYQYVLISGAGSSVGKFEPVNNAAAFDNIDDIKAVYPAIAATVAGGKLSLSLNKEYTEQERAKYGITSWTKSSSAYAFTHNDIKVSYSTSMKTSADARSEVNFKFRQLATWCNFVFDFTGIPEYKLESVESLTVTTVDGTKKISGTAEVDLTDPNRPVLKEGTETSVEWATTGSLNSAALTKSLMLFPVIDGDKLKITVKTNMNTFTFYATPTQPFTAGTVLRFPIDLGVNFQKDNAATAKDFTYQVVPIEIHDFFYYGTANCLLLTGTTTAGTLDATPYKTNAYYWNTKDDGSAAPKPAKAKVIWREAGITSMAEPTVTANGNKYTLNVSGVQGYGNALVGIYDNADNLLWSYHIWKPEIDPTSAENLLEYKYTNSGTYYVMPIALGATNKVTIKYNEAATNDNLKAYGLYYQWGRKDPMGRSAALTGNTFVTTYAGATGTTPFVLKDKFVQLRDLLGTDFNIHTDKKDDKSADRWAVDYGVAHPDVFIGGSGYSNQWVGKPNTNLWGNPLGYQYPRNSTLQQSIFDPCPAGYRVAPADLYLAFTIDGRSGTVSTSSESYWATNIFNIANINADGKSTTMATQRGFFFYYETDADNMRLWHEGKTDFYPASGYRSSGSGSLGDVGNFGICKYSTPMDASGNGGVFFFHGSMVSLFTTYYAEPGFGNTLRCVKAH